MEVVGIRELMDKVREFPRPLRCMMGVIGTLQTALSLYFDQPVSVRLVGQADDGVTITRSVDLVLPDGTAVCSADSKIARSTTRGDLTKEIVEGKMGLGQILAKHNVRFQGRVLDAGADESSFWRRYEIAGENVWMNITERFPKHLYEEGS